jgi:hypothetical protein
VWTMDRELLCGLLIIAVPVLTALYLAGRFRF